MPNKRPLTYYEPLMVKLEPALKRRLKIESVRQETDMSKMTRQAIIEFLNKIERRRARSSQESEEAAEEPVAA